MTNQPDDPPTTANMDFPNRPDHPDFHWLSRAVQEIDATSEQPGFNVRASLPADAESLIYLARQRAIMALNYVIHTGTFRAIGLPGSLPASVRTALEAAIAAALLDGFALGVRYGREVEQDGRG
jgi:hypothetical protein